MIDLDLQIACEFDDLPNESQFSLWANTALKNLKPDAEMTIRISDAQESQLLNFEYRGKDKPTNVLSFEFEAPPEIVKKESIEQEKSFHDHFAHMVIHGCLHLLGFDHIDKDEAIEMESLEKQILAGLGIDDPYRDDV